LRVSEAQSAPLSFTLAYRIYDSICHHSPTSCFGDYWMGTPSTSFATHSDGFAAGGCVSYEFALDDYTQYTFSLVNFGGTAAGPAWLSLTYLNPYLGCMPIITGAEITQYTGGWDGLYVLSVYCNPGCDYTVAYAATDLFVPECATCPSYDYGLDPPGTAWRTAGADLDEAECAVIMFRLTAGKTYTFTTCEGGGSCAGDSLFYVWNSGCQTVAFNDDYCGLGSRLEYSPPVSGDYLLKVAGFAGQSLDATVAFRGLGSCRTCPDFDYDAGAPLGWWSAHSGSFYAGGCRIYRFSLDSGLPPSHTVKTYGSPESSEKR